MNPKVRERFDLHWSFDQRRFGRPPLQKWGHSNGYYFKEEAKFWEEKMEHLATR